MYSNFYWSNLSSDLLKLAQEKRGERERACVYTGKNTKWAEIFIWCLLLLFKVVYQDHWHSYFPLHGISSSERAAAGLGPSGLICAIADRDCTDTVCSGSWPREKNPLLHRGLEHTSVLHLDLSARPSNNSYSQLCFETMSNKKMRSK